MLTPIKYAVVFVGSLVLIGCATPSQPQRTAYSGTDNVDTVSSAMMVGKWNVSILNPIEGEETIKEVKVNYLADGTVTMTTLSQTSSGPMGTVALEMAGSWKIEGDNVWQQLDSIKETSGNTMAKFLVGMMGNFKHKFSGTANVYEASSNRLVLVSEEGQAQELIRIP